MTERVADEVVELLEVEAAARCVLHSDHTKNGRDRNRTLSPDYQLVGLVGEAEFSRQFRQPLDLARKPNGDGGVDFVVPLSFTVDVKTAHKAIYLIVEQNRVACDVYVLAQYLSGDHPSAELLGWEWGSVIARAPVKDFGHGILNHYIRREELRPIADLQRRVMRLA